MLGEILRRLFVPFANRDVVSERVLKPGGNADLLEPLATAGWLLRYGVSPEEKHAMTVRGEIPGTERAYRPGATPADRDDAERAASGYLASRNRGLLGAGASLLFSGLREGAQGLGTMLGGGEFLAPGGLQSQAPEEQGLNMRALQTTRDAVLNGLMDSPGLSGLLMRHMLSR